MTAKYRTRLTVLLATKHSPSGGIRRRGFLCLYLFLLPVVPDVLHVVVVLQKIDELLHVLDVGFA